MFLKNVEIFGFKSFADKCKIEFGDGISTIVGPNGCGKSNVIEAIRWALGEQSAKGMRLEKMNNVIFNGTEHRHPLNVAEVTLTFSNEKNYLPLEFSEVSIKRRVFRSSNSEYFINGNQVTLKELRELLAGTGLGVTEYIVMEQGKLDHILNAKPEDRRTILEEAAGISKFRMRSAEGTRKRERMQENIIQIEQILYEVEKQHKTLKSQSEKALLFRSLSEKVFSYEVILVCQKHQGFEDKLTHAQIKLTELEEKLNIHEEQEKKLKGEHNEFQHNIKKIEGVMIEQQRRHSVVQAEKEAIKRLLKTNQEHIEDIKSQQTIFEAQSKNLHKKQADLQKEKESLNKELAAQHKNITLVNTSIKETQKKIENTEKNIVAQKNAQVLVDKQEAQINTALEKHQKELRTVVDRLAEELDKQLSKSGYSANLQNTLEAKLQHLHEQLKLQVANLKDIIADTAISNDSIAIATIKSLINTLYTTSHQVVESFQKYNEVIPTFLNEFLENDGVLSHKHLIDEKLHTLNADKQRCHDARAEITKTRETLETEKITLNKYANELNIHKNTYFQAIENLKKDDLRVQKSIEDIVNQIKSLNNQIAGQKTALKKWESELKTNQKKYEELDKEDTNTYKNIADLQKKVGTQHGEAQVYLKKIENSHAKISAVHDEILKTKEHVSELDTRIKMLAEDFRDRHGEMLTFYLKNKDYQEKSKEDAQSIKQKLAEVKNEITTLGHVNMLAAEEFVSVNDRYNHLTTQLADLQKADENLKAVIDKIELESRKKLEETFVAVRKHFKTLFVRVMNGGTSDLVLVNSEDILEAGLEIIAQPPEKKTQYLSQLSGGERALIALCLLFALHSVKPVPFCMLDELDAPLDDQNIEKFLELIYSFKDDTQFVVISHNKKSIAFAQNIIGVSMEERGISKIIGVQLNEKEKVTV